MANKKFLLLTFLSIGLVSGATTPLTNQSKSEKLKEFKDAAVSSDGLPCSTIGKKVLEEGGKSMDSAVATLFCMGVVNPQSMGLGGGFFLTYYNKHTQTAYTLDSREKAPGAAFKDMYDGNSTLSLFGGLAVAVPGELRGYREAYKKFGGGLPWKRLIEPSIKLCEDGNPVSKHMATALKYVSHRLLQEPSMSVFVNPETGKVWNEGDILKRPDLAKTLKVIQHEPDALHNGSLTNDFILDLQSLGSIITREDMKKYRPIWMDAYPMEFSNKFTLFSTPPPGSGLILGYIMKILQHYNFNKGSINRNKISTTYHRIAEAFKFAYARRTELGDMDFSNQIPLINELLSDTNALETFGKIKDNFTSQDPKYYGSKYSITNDHGTSHVSIIGPNGDAVSATSTVNYYFGAGIISASTGIVLNDEMNDFAIPGVTNIFNLPPFKDNYISSGKRPVSSMCPVVVINKKGDVVLADGAAGGTKISTSVAWTMIQNLWLGANIKEAIDAKRMHHQLFPMKLVFESGFDESIVSDLQNIGHITDFGIRSAVTAVERIANGNLHGYSDPRKGGGADGY